MQGPPGKEFPGTSLEIRGAAQEMPRTSWEVSGSSWEVPGTSWEPILRRPVFKSMYVPPLMALLHLIWGPNSRCMSLGRLMGKGLLFFDRDTRI